MSKDLQSVSLLDILPPNLLADKKINAAARALDDELQKITAATRNALLLPRLDELSEEVIDLLAWQWHVDFYEPIGMDIETKRRLIKNSIAWHRIKGTPAAVEQVVSAVFDTSHVQEWFEYGGKPYHFKVITEDVTTDPNVLARMRRAINAAKNTRSWLETIEFILHLQDEEKAEDAHGLEVHKTMIERYPWRGRYFDGSWCFTDSLRMDGGRVFDGSWQLGGVSPGDEDAISRGRIFDGTWKFDGQQDFNLNSASRKILFNSLEVDALHLAQELSVVDRHGVTFQFDGRRFDGSWLLGPNEHAQDVTLETMAALTLADTERAMDTAQIAPQIETTEIYPFVHLRHFDGRWSFGRAAPLDGAWRFDGVRIFDGASGAPDIAPLAGVFDGTWQLDGTGSFAAPPSDARFDSDEDVDEQTSLSATLTKLEDRVTVQDEKCELTVTVGRVFNGAWNFDAGNASFMDGAWRLDGGRFFTVRRAVQNRFDGAFDMGGIVRFERGGETFEQYRYTA
ncbi:phage tail protein [uncultured Selenomonas sp.]|uniref:phage tail protein n=1 Tax=uncultured Selenomonas sp. TaxID=159275 RepID=UPI0028E65AA3|nr:phage tail protein [uncultured Selenomonas sp.]